MRNGFLVLFLALVCAGTALAQKTPVPASTEQQLDLPPLAPPVPSPPQEAPRITDASASPNTFWAGIEALLWWLKASPLPTPLVTTGNPNDGVLAGTLASPDTRVLFGGSNLNLNAIGGGRFTIGGWITAEPILGLELSGFFLEKTSTPFQAVSDGNGNPPLYLPAFNAVSRKEDSAIISDPVQQFSGSVQVSSVTRLWGTELNGIFAGWSGPGFGLQLLAGFRYLDLEESLQMQSTSSDLVNDSQIALSDNFETRNQFYGGQIGARLDLVRNHLSASLTGKLALGSTLQEVNINGSATQTGTAAALQGTFPGGFFTQPTNIGRRTHDEFSLVPEAQVKLGYDILPGWRAFVGYDLLYWTQVVRPGNQIDRNLNLTQSPIFGSGTLAGPAQPAALFNRSDFWAQGLTFGFQFSY